MRRSCTVRTHSAGGQRWIQRDQSILANEKVCLRYSAIPGDGFCRQYAEGQELETSRPLAVFVRTGPGWIAIHRHSFASAGKKARDNILFVSVMAGGVAHQKRANALANKIERTDGAVQAAGEERHAIDLRKIDHAIAAHNLG